jgi:hypothetical protein
MLISAKRGGICAVITIILEWYAFTFNPRNAAIIATRSTSRQIADYVLNFVIFFLVIYLFTSLIIFIVRKFVSKIK